MMKIEVKLYSYHDMDLVSLYKSGRVAFPEATRQVLNSYANKEVYKIKLLDVNQKRLDRYPSDSYRKYYHYHIILDDKEDIAAIELLKKITPGCRNNFIKVVLRQYLCCALPTGYSIDGDTRLFREMTNKFQGGLDEREIKQTKKIKTNTQKKKRTKAKKRPEIQSKESIQEVIEPEIKQTMVQKSQELPEEHQYQNVTFKPEQDNLDLSPTPKPTPKPISEPIPEPEMEAESDDDSFDIDDFLTGATEQY